MARVAMIGATGLVGQSVAPGLVVAQPERPQQDEPRRGHERGGPEP